MLEIAPRITVDPAVQDGLPVVSGTRVPVELILGQLAGGMSEAEVAAEYARTVEDVRAALAYAARAISSERVRAY